MNAIEEIEMMDQAQILLGTTIPVMSYKALKKLPEADLITLHTNVGIHVHMKDLDMVTDDPALEYYFNICDVCESHVLNEMTLDRVLASASERLHSKLQH